MTTKKQRVTAALDEHWRNQGHLTHSRPKHAIDGTIYPVGYPLILCTCGVSVAGNTWQDAGAAFDAHLEER